MKVFKKAGFSYQQFLVVFSLVGLLLITKVILTYSPYPAAVLFLYMLFPYSLDTVQIRFFMASALILFSLHLLLSYKKEKKRRNILFFFLFMLLAAGTHYSAFFFFPLVLLFLDEDRHALLCKVILPAGLIILPALLIPMSELFSSVISMQKVNSWLRGGSPATMTRVVRLLLCRGGVLFLCLLGRHLPTDAEVDAQGEVESAQEKTLFLLIVCILFFTSFEIFLGREYERLTRPAYLLAWIYLSRRMLSMEFAERLVMWVLIFGVLFINFYAIMFLGTVVGGDRMFDTVFLNLFKTNALLKNLF